MSLTARLALEAREAAARLGTPAWRVLTGLGVALAIVYWWQLTTTGGAPVDARWYWSADPANLYPHPELAEANGYNYSPAFELVIGWGRLLPFEVFTAIWRAVTLVGLVVLAGPLTVPALLWTPVASEVNAGNIQILLALAIVAGFRWPGTWAFVLLTKVSPGLGLGWFLLRRRWRDLAVAVAVTVAIAAVTAALWPDRWVAYLRLLSSGATPSVAPWYLSLWDRLPWAVTILVIGAWRGWRWPVVVAAMLALPVFYTISPSMLIGTLPFLRAAVGRWLAGPAPTVPAGSLPAQARSESGAILAP